MRNNNGYGVVYTPDSLSEYVAHLLINEYKKDIAIDNQADNLMILDPACGEGALLAACERVCQTNLNCQPNLYVGIDVEKKVILSNRTKFKGRHYAFYANDALLPAKTMNPIEYWTKKDIRPSLIIANPPWSSEKVYDKKRLSDAGFKFDVGQYDSYVLFIELCLKLLKPNGYIALIIPDSIFSSENRELRKHLAENTQLRVISRLGEKLFPSVNRATTILVIKNAKPSDSDETVCFRLTTDQRKAYFAGEKTLLEYHQQYAHSVMQKRFRDNSGYIFDIDTQKSEEELLRKMEENAIEWNKVFHFGRGVEISKTGMVVVCPHCGIAQGYSKKQFIEGTKKCIKCSEGITVSEITANKIIDTQEHNGYKKIYVGENLHRYAISGSCYIKMNVPGINYKEEKLYNPPKILIRKTGLGINACIDYESTYISQTVYSCNYLDTSHNAPLEYYLGVLNSRVLYYYYLKKYGENEWKSHPYFTKDIVFSLPIPQVTSTNNSLCKHIAKYVLALQTEYSRSLDLKIERLVADLYGLTRDEVEMVITVMNQLPDLGAINHMKIKEDELCLDI